MKGVYRGWFQGWASCTPTHVRKPTAPSVPCRAGGTGAGAPLGAPTGGAAGRLRAIGMEWCVWVIKHAPQHQLKAMAPTLLARLLPATGGTAPAAAAGGASGDGNATVRPGMETGRAVSAGAPEYLADLIIQPGQRLDTFIFVFLQYSLGICLNIELRNRLARTAGGCAHSWRRQPPGRRNARMGVPGSCGAGAAPARAL
jgi:hypothetical protein